MTKVPTVQGPPLHERMLDTAIEMENCTDLSKMAGLFVKAAYLLRGAAPVVQGEQRLVLSTLAKIEGELTAVRGALGSEVCCTYCGEEL